MSNRTTHGRPLLRGEIYGLVLAELKLGPGTCHDIARRLDLQPWGSHMAAQILSTAYHRGDVTRTGHRGRGAGQGYTYALRAEVSP